MNNIEEYNLIINQIDTYKKNNLPIPRAFYSRQFELVTEMNDTFEKEKIEDISCYAQGIKYNMILKYLAEKIGKPVEDYRQKIRDYGMKLTGTEISDEEMDVKD